MKKNKKLKKLKKLKKFKGKEEVEVSIPSLNWMPSLSRKELREYHKKLKRYNR